MSEIGLTASFGKDQYDHLKKIFKTLHGIVKSPIDPEIVGISNEGIKMFDLDGTGAMSFYTYLNSQFFTTFDSVEDKLIFLNLEDLVKMFSITVKKDDTITMFLEDSTFVLEVESTDTEVVKRMSIPLRIPSDEEQKLNFFERKDNLLSNPSDVIITAQKTILKELVADGIKTLSKVAPHVNLKVDQDKVSFSFQNKDEHREFVVEADHSKEDNGLHVSSLESDELEMLLDTDYVKLFIDLNGVSDFTSIKMLDGSFTAFRFVNFDGDSIMQFTLAPVGPDVEVEEDE